MSGTVYCHNNYGPIPYKHDLLLVCLKENFFIESTPIFFDQYEGELIIGLKEFNKTLFSEDEKEIASHILRHFRKHTTSEMTKISQKEDAYLKTQKDALISYEYADTLKEIY